MKRHAALGSLAFAIAMLAPSVQAATTFTWNLTGSESVLAPSTNASTNSKTFTSTVGSVTKSLTVTALYTSNNDGSGNLRARESSTGNYARLQAYSGGLGIVNPVDSGETNEPSHGVDTSGRNDFLLFDFGQVMNLDSFRIGYKGGDSDIDIWVGPDSASSINFANANGTNNGTTVASLVAAGFTKYNSFNDVAVNTTVNVPDNPSGSGPARFGRYMMVSGVLGQSNDAFKFSKITATTPTPGTVALLGIGLLGFALARRNPKVRARH
jgi:hypothetical protein